MLDMAAIRADIDALDLQVKELLLKRMDCSEKVAHAKLEQGSTDVYRPDREREILDKLGEGVPAERKAFYLGAVQKIIEASRMYQYDIMYDNLEGVFEAIEGSELAGQPGTQVTVRLSRPDKPGSMGTILSMVGDRGFNVDRLAVAGMDPAAGLALFDLTILGNLADEGMRRLMFQLSKECVTFRIMCVC